MDLAPAPPWLTLAAVRWRSTGTGPITGHVDDDQRRRLHSLGAVLGLYSNPEMVPTPAELIALAEWVAVGSISAATTLEGQKAALYNQHLRTRDDS